jgi:hypothetical protein
MKSIQALMQGLKALSKHIFLLSRFAKHIQQSLSPLEL